MSIRAETLDQHLLLRMRATFLDLLDRAYEDPHRRAARRAALAAAEQAITS